MQVIRSYRDGDTRSVHERRRVRKIPDVIQRRAVEKLISLNGVKDINDLRTPPGNRLEILAGDRSGQHSIRINDQWRICFIWDGEDAWDVEIVDYH